MAWLVALAAILATWTACIAWTLPVWIAVIGTLLVGGAALALRGRFARKPIGRGRLGVVATCFVLAATTVPFWMGTLQDRLRFVRESEEEVRRARLVHWTPNEVADDTLGAFDALRVRIHEIDRRSTSERFVDAIVGGRTLREMILGRYAVGLEEGFIRPCMADFERRFRADRPADYATEHRELKAYLTLSEGRAASVDDAAETLAALWAEKLRATTRSAERVEELSAALVLDELRWIAAKEIPAPPPDAQAVAALRERLRAGDPSARAFALLVSSVGLETARRDGKLRAPSFPPLSLFKLGGLFQKPRALTSRRYEAGRHSLEVGGPYTAAGRARVLENVSDGRAILEREAWVDGGDAAVEFRNVELRALESAYERRYVEAWRAWLSDLRTVQPATVSEALELYRVLTQEEAPLAIALRSLAANTQPGTSAIERRSVPPRIAQFFASTSQFWSGFDETVPAASALGSPLSAYLERLRQLRSTLQGMRSDDAGRVPPAAQELLAEMAAETRRSLAPHDAFAQEVLAPLLLDPLSIGGVAPREPRGESVQRSTTAASWH